jgi:hypothetical protein
MRIGGFGDQFVLVVGMALGASRALATRSGLAKIENLLGFRPAALAEVGPEHLNEQTGLVATLRVPRVHRFVFWPVGVTPFSPNGAKTYDGREPFDNVAVCHAEAGLGHHPGLVSPRG